MASLDTLVLYEHILSLVDPTELHRSSNSVLQKKFFDLAKSVSDVVATFAKVEEVRDAMNQLEQGNVLTGRSDSLMREMENSMNLQQKLEEALKKVTMEIAVVSILRKTNRGRKEWIVVDSGWLSCSSRKKT
ncbi:hypothetical protein AM587_10004817 [Phytophthora nicotianae]|uniref:Uncharacterized protein n=1 Tax=Phytophthora nicotianae TaxID=4792 RepID=A0A0W8CX59_PHYNI|nr:hypothetical protein AM587_10004817 [Phytophthora nicotianae]